MTKPVYLDYNATTPVHPDVLQAMLPCFSENFGNASSKTHAYGWEAAHAVKKARASVATLLQVGADEITFTSGATEALNLAIRGLAENWKSKKAHLISWQTEHRAVLDTLLAMDKAGFEITLLPVDKNGRPSPEALKSALRPDTLLVIGMLANNETGVLFPIAELAEITHAAGAWFCCDATQAVGKIPVDAAALGVDFLAGSAHKFYGPKGVGFLYQKSGRSSPKIRPQLSGGGHEAGLRSGTLNVPGIVGLGAAARLATISLAAEADRQQKLIGTFEKVLQSQIPDCYFPGGASPRLPNTSNSCISHAPAAALLKKMRAFALSTGSACSSAEATASHVLLAYGLSEQEAGCCLRFSIGRYTTEADLLAAAACLTQAVAEVRAESHSWKYK